MRLIKFRANIKNYCPSADAEDSDTDKFAYLNKEDAVLDGKIEWREKKMERETYLVRKSFRDGKIEERKFQDDFQAAAEYYFQEKKPFEYGRNGGRIELVRVSKKVIFSCA